MNAPDKLDESLRLQKQLHQRIASPAEKLPHNFAWRCEDGRGDIKRLQLQRQPLEINPTQMLVACQQE